MKSFTPEESAMKRNFLKQRQSLPLHLKVQMTKRRIQEFYDHFDGKVYVCFSGGKDSTVLLHLVRSLYPEVPAVFVDTGLEYPEVRQFVKQTENVTVIRPEITFKDVLQNYGYPVISKEVAQHIEDYRKHPDGYAACKFDSNSDYVKKYGSRYDLSKWIPLRDSDIKISSQCCKIMKKKPSEIKDIAKEIISQTEKYYFTVTEIANLFGISRTTATEMCKEIPPAQIFGTKKYYIYDVISFIYK